MAWTTGDRVMTYREKWHWFDVAVETLDGWRRHQGGKNASLLAFFTFLSIFPLILAAITILGFLLDGNEDLRQRLIDGAMAEIPVIGDEIASDPNAISGNWFGLVVGLGGALWSSTRAFVGFQSAIDDTWEVPLDGRASMPIARGKALVGLAIIGASQVGSIAITSIVSAADLPVASGVLLQASTFALNIVVLGSMYWFLTSASVSWRRVWPGAIPAGIILTLLQIFGTRLVQRFAEGSESFATVNTIIGLITWLSLVGIVTVMFAEFNAALVRLEDGPKVQEGADFDLPIRA